MSYCVNCGVELGAGAGSCPLCHTPVQNPHAVPDKDAPPFFPPRHEGVEPVSRRMAGLLLSWQGDALEPKAGDSVLLPASCPPVTLMGVGQALISTPPARA